MKKILMLLLACFAMCGCASEQRETENVRAVGNSIKTETIVEAEHVFEESETLTELQPEIIESGWDVLDVDGTKYVRYGIKAKNPNEDVAIESLKLNITARDSAGRIISTTDEFFGPIAPQDSFSYGYNFRCDENPETVEFAVSGSEYISSDDQELIRTADFEISNVTETKDEYWYTYKGDVKSNSIDVNAATVTILYKNNGEIVGGISAMIYDVNSSETVPFEIETFQVPPEHDDIEVSAHKYY